MKRALLGLAMVVSLVAANGCTALGPCSNGKCADGSCGIDGHAKGHLGSHHGSHAGAVGTHPRLMALKRHMHGPGPHDGMYGPPSAAIAYPYYTTRAPRDYFEPNPATIGR
jgi:hypothetical protein